MHEHPDKKENVSVNGFRDAKRKGYFTDKEWMKAQRCIGIREGWEARYAGLDKMWKWGWIDRIYTGWDFENYFTPKGLNDLRLGNNWDRLAKTHQDAMLVITAYRMERTMKHEKVMNTWLRIIPAAYEKFMRMCNKEKYRNASPKIERILSRLYLLN